MMEPAVRGLPKPVDCPNCGSATGLVVVYGMPSLDLFEAAENDQVALGGCVIVPGQPDYRCSACGHQWMSDEP